MIESLRRDFLMVAILGFLGGALFSYFDVVPPVMASREGREILKSEKLELTDGNGPAIWFSRLEPTGGIFSFHDHKIRLRLSGAIYPGGTHSYLGIMSRINDINPKVIFKLEGGHQNAMFFFKNERDQHRIDLGVNFDDVNEEPYFVYFDKNGVKTHIFGKFPWIENAGKNIR